MFTPSRPFRKLGCVLALLYVPALGAQKISPLEHTVDASIKPGDDFFAYANGAWLKATTIPAGKERWGARDETNARVRLQIADLFGDLEKDPRGSLAKKVADFRTAYANAAAIDARRTEPLAPTLARINAISDKEALTNYLGATTRADVDPLNIGIFASSTPLGLSVERSIHGEKNYRAFLVQGGLGLGDREQYLSTDAKSVERRTSYERYVGDMLSLAGFDNCTERAKGVVALEKALAESHATSAATANDRNADNRWTHDDWIQRAPGMNWHTYFKAAGIGGQDTIVAWQPSAATGLAAQVNAQSLETWKDYLRFHLIDRYADVLPRSFAERAASFRGDTASRAQRAFVTTQSAMSDAIGRLYAERYFPPAQKSRVQKIVANVGEAFAKRVETTPWMSPQFRKTALSKLKVLYVGIGYPEKWDDYLDLVIDPTDPVGNLERIADRERKHALARLDKPVDPYEWSMAPQQAGAVLIFQQNAYEFAAALLQPPKYDPSAADAALYGSIGAIIGHDMSHFIDALGADYEVDGRMQRWWSAKDSAAFDAAAEPLVAQFSAYRAFPDQAVNGRLTRNENVADLAGITAAFDAYRKSIGSKTTDKAYVRAHDREFFLAFAQAWRARLSEAALRAQVATNDHAPEMFRFSTVRNLDAWYDAFDVKPGERLYLAPSARVRVW